MPFTPGQVLTAAQLNALDINSLTVDTSTLVVDATNDHVGIGIASPAEPLHISAAAPRIQLTDSDNGADSIISAGNGNVTISADENGDAASSYIAFKTDNTERLRVNSSEPYLSGMALEWSAWTPTLADISDTTSTNTLSRYIRIGDLVIAHFNITCTTSGNGGAVQIKDLPVTAASANGIGGVAYIRDASSAANTAMLMPIGTSTTSVQFFESGSNTSRSTPLNNGDHLDGTLIYESA